MSSPPVETTGPCTRVFWDLMDFRLPSPDPRRTYRTMNYILEKIGFLGELSIVAYVDQECFLDHLLDEYKSAGITIIHHPQQGDKYASMLVDIILWALENPANYFEPLNLMVISGNIKEETDFLKALEALGHRYYNVLLAMPQPLSSSKLHTVSFDGLSTSLDQRVTLQGLNHKWNRKSREENVGFSYGLASLYPQYFRGAEVTVFWDVQDRVTSVPKIGPALRGLGYDGAVLIRPYVDGDHQWKWNAKNACLGLHLDPLTRVLTKEAKVTRMLLDLLFWAMNNDDIPANFMLISKPDINCDRVIKAVEHRGFFHIRGCSDEVSLHLKSAPYGEMQINQSIKLQGRKFLEGLEHAAPSIVVFWLLEEDYPSDPKLANWRIRSALDKKGYGNITSVTVYVNEEKFPSGWKDAYHKSGMGVVFIDEDYGLSKIDTMSWDMIKWRYADALSSQFVVIAKPFRDMTLDRFFEDFECGGFYVLFEQPDYLFTLGSAVWSAKNLSF